MENDELNFRGHNQKQADRYDMLELALNQAKADDVPRWIVAMAETFRKYVETGELQG